MSTNKSNPIKFSLPKPGRPGHAATGRRPNPLDPGVLVRPATPPKAAPATPSVKTSTAVVNAAQASQVAKPADSIGNNKTNQLNPDGQAPYFDKALARHVALLQAWQIKGCDANEREDLKARLNRLWEYYSKGLQPEDPAYRVRHKQVEKVQQTRRVFAAYASQNFDTIIHTHEQLCRKWWQSSARDESERLKLNMDLIQYTMPLLQGRDVEKKKLRRGVIKSLWLKPMPRKRKAA